MYRLQSAAPEQWTIVDQTDQVVCSGTLRECEDWLDRQENLQRRAQRERAFGRWLDRILVLLHLKRVETTSAPMSSQRHAQVTAERGEASSLPES